MEKKISKKVRAEVIKDKAVKADKMAETPSDASAVPAKKRVVKTVKRKTASGGKSAKKQLEKAVKVDLPAVEKLMATEPVDVTSQLAATEPQVELSPAFMALAEPRLPELTRENRAMLLMQSPTKLYFYWSAKEDPYHMLRRAFGSDTGSYTLVLKLTDRRRETEEIHRVDAEGNWWFDVEPDGEYQAEIGFYAPNRPYFRVIYSNIVKTPRRTPSRGPATEAKWTVSANKFAQVLDVAGFAQDAVEVAIAGDDQTASDIAAQAAISRFTDVPEHRFDGIAADELRYAMIAFASGHQLEDLRWRVGPTLFAALGSTGGSLTPDSARSAMTEYMDIDATEFDEEEVGPAVFGTSVVNFPRTLKRRTVSRLNPVSSHTVGRA